MPHQTKVLTVSSQEAGELEKRLTRELPDAEWRRVPHARFSLKHAGVVITCYKSGKVVLQGQDLEIFAQRFLGAAVEVSKGDADGDAQFDLGRETIGSDETGKGDYFGPLVVAAVYSDQEGISRLQEAGAADSKQLTDRRVSTIAGFVRDNYDTEISRLMPADYNRSYSGNLNDLLADLHTTSLAALVKRHGTDVAVVVDKFAAKKLLVDRLESAEAMPDSLICVPRAEAHPVVAAASIVARQAFLEGLAECEELCGVDLHKGAGAPVDKIARRIYRIGGKDLLGTAAKLHFRNTDRAMS